MTRLFKRQVINMNYLFEDHGLSWQNFDERAYIRSASHFTAVATKLQDGKKALFTDLTGEKLKQVLIASCSMPFMMDPAPTPDGLCLDGGIADSIPFDVAQEQGYDKIIVVRTRDISYRKKPSSRPVCQLYRRYFKDYPQFAEAGILRPEVYNQQVAQIEHLRRTGQIFNIAPQHPIKVGRVESNVKKIRKLYETGQQEARQLLPSLIDYLNA